MPVALKSQKSIITPRLDGIKDPVLLVILNDLAKTIRQIGLNVYDDLNTVGKCKPLNFTRDMTAASGDVTYAGFGFMPRNVLIIAGINAAQPASFGFSDGVVNFDLRSEAVLSADQIGMITTSTINLLSAVGVGQSAVVKSFNSDGFILTWTKAGVPGAGSANLFCLAFS